MVSKIFQKLSDFILMVNPYLNTGFPNVIKDNTTGKIWYEHPESDEKEVVFPNDRLGTYFYLRNEGLMNFTLTPESNISDCFFGANQFSIPQKIVCVFASRIDPYDMIQNLVSTFAQFQYQIALANAEWNSERIIQSEMSGFPSEDIQAALQRGSVYNMISMNFNMTCPIELLDLKCITNPCVSTCP